MAMKARYEVIDSEIIAEKRGGVRRTLVPDPLGATRALLNNTQSQTDSFSYWPYGESSERTATTATPFQFIGLRRYYRDASDRAYVIERHLSTRLGRWFSQDPFAQKAHLADTQSYVMNNPTTLIDPNGLFPVIPDLCRAIKLYFCMQDAIQESCIGVNGPIYAYAWCIISGESDWDPSLQTECNPTSAPSRPDLWGQHACGLFQLIAMDEGPGCIILGYPNWKTD